jgi:IPT/TIG domain/S-layer homology domain
MQVKSFHINNLQPDRRARSPPETEKPPFLADHCRGSSRRANFGEVLDEVLVVTNRPDFRVRVGFRRLRKSPTSASPGKGNFIGTQKDGGSPLGNLQGVAFVGVGRVDRRDAERRSWLRRAPCHRRRMLCLAAPLLPGQLLDTRPDGRVHRQNFRPPVKDPMKRIAASILLCLSSLPLAAVTFTVINTDDSGPGSFRQAIFDANAAPGLDTIAFGIPGAGVHTISPATPLPGITDTVVIDGYSQPGASPNTDPDGFDGTLLIELSGAGGGPMNGIQISAGGSTVRGLVINRFAGLTTDAGNAIFLNTAGGNHIEGNFLGTDAGGTTAQINEDNAIIVGSGGNFIGGATPGARNVIAASGRVALFILTGGNVIQGNFIGTQKDGVSPLGNQQGVGFVGFGGANGNIVGGTALGEANVIAFSEIRGVIGEASSGTGNPIRGNSIHDNGALGIDLLGAVGPSANDPGDSDAGSNNLQNFPILKSVEHSLSEGSGSTRIIGKLDSAPSTTYDLDFYSNSVCSNFPREFVEGETWLGTAQVTTDASGHADIDVNLAVATEAGARITATATDPAGNTSEFSQRIIFSINPPSGPDTGGTAFTVSGTDFADPSTITVGGVAATGVSFVDDHQLSATMPVLAPGSSNDVVVTTPDGTTGTLIKGWVADFLDVPSGHLFHDFVVTLVSNGITVGVGGGNYGVDQGTKRQQMTVFLLKAKHGLCYVPPTCAGTFPDVPCPSLFADWIEALAAEGITTGCGGGLFCPNNLVTRRQMAVFLLKSKYGSGYVPPACTGVFDDVPCPGAPAVDFIEQLAAEQITGGCSTMAPLYCPDNSSTRGQMAVFIVKTFGL